LALPAVAATGNQLPVDPIFAAIEQKKGIRASGIGSRLWLMSMSMI
jgi:hypothetical protein